eukprot:1908881-Alexandrium_andersonii.AAC.1
MCIRDRLSPYWHPRRLSGSPQSAHGAPRSAWCPPPAVGYVSVCTSSTPPSSRAPPRAPESGSLGVALPPRGAAGEPGHPPVA